MNDIVQRLGRHSKRYARSTSERLICGQCQEEWPCLYGEAANEIERLRASIHEAYNELYVERYDRAESILKEAERAQAH